MNLRRQSGVTTVEFAIVGLVLMAMIFGIFEVSRGYYTAAMLDEVTRRGARVAAVCPVGDPAIAQLAVLNASGDSGRSRFVRDLLPAHVVVDYLDAAGAVVANPADAASFLQIRLRTGPHRRVRLPREPAGHRGSLVFRDARLRLRHAARKPRCAARRRDNSLLIPETLV